MSVNKYNASTGELTTLANGSRIWIGSKAAHDAAKQAGTLPTNCLIAITDDEKDDEYSTDEVLTSKKWIDGKPIYRKCCKYTDIIASGTYRTIMTISNIDSLVSLSGSFRNNNDSNRFPLGYVYSDNTEAVKQYGRVAMMGSNGDIIFMAYGFSMTDIIAIAEYTKTTD